MAADVRRKLPSVDALLRSEAGRRAAASLGRPLLKLELVRALERHRERARAGGDLPDPDEVLAEAAGSAARILAGLTPVINATGVVLHTNLGRAPLSEEAVDAVSRAARGYTDLEIDRTSGRRGRRTTRAETMLVALTGAEDALVVNNGAAALLLALVALAKGKRVLVSRGELIEIGGEFRIPDIVAASGARFVEVGTTNRTRIGDYRAAADDRLGAILKVHPSNYRVVGFTAAPAPRELAALARSRGVPFLYDVGSGLPSSERGLPPDEPTLRDALEQGADLVVASGDKLLGGPQAGLVVGRADLVQRLRGHPIARVVRVDKLQVAALEATLRAHLLGEHRTLPVHRMLHEPPEEVARRAHRLAEILGGDLVGARVRRSASVVGGGSMPGHQAPSWAVALHVPDATAFAARLRMGSPAVAARIEDGSVVLDCRTVTDGELPDLARAVAYAREGDDLDDEGLAKG